MSASPTSDRRGDDRLRADLLTAASTLWPQPDPLAGVAVAEAAAAIGESPSTVSYQIPEVDGEPGGPAEFRQLVYIEIIRRFRTGRCQTLQDVVKDALFQGVGLERTVVAFGDALAAALIADPSTVYLLAASSRIDAHLDLADARRRAWEAWTETMTDHLELILAAHRHQVSPPAGRAHLGELVRTAAVAGWVQQQLMPADVIGSLSDRTADGAGGGTAGLVLWSTARHHVEEAA